MTSNMRDCLKCFKRKKATIEFQISFILNWFGMKCSIIFFKFVVVVIVWVFDTNLQLMILNCRSLLQYIDEELKLR